MDLPQELIDQAAKLIDDGKTFEQVFRVTLIPLDIIEKHHGEWLANLKGGRFSRQASISLTPSTRLTQIMPQAAKLLEERDVDGFFEMIAPIAAMQMAKDAVQSSDERVRQSAQKDILDRAGYKPKTQVELYTKYDRMQRDELIAGIRGAMMANPEFAVKVLGIQDALSKGKLMLSPSDKEAAVIVERVRDEEVAQSEAQEWEDL